MIIEGMRTDSLMFAGLRVSQWLSLILIFVGIGIIITKEKSKPLITNRNNRFVDSFIRDVSDERREYDN